jgi:hypothetical protein
MGEGGSRLPQCSERERVPRARGPRFVFGANEAYTGKILEWSATDRTSLAGADDPLHGIIRK